MIKSRKAKNSKRGLYLQDNELKQTAFQPGTNFKYVIDTKNKKMVIIPSESSVNTVSKRATKSGVKPVIDIRNKEALSIFREADYLQVEIQEDQIIVSGYEEKSSSALAKVSKKIASVFSKKSNVLDITSLLDVRKKFEFRLGSDELAKAVGHAQQFVQLSIFDVIGDTHSYSSQSIQTIEKGLKNIKVPLQVISLFSGAGIMDKGFVEEGFDISFALELDEDAVATYRANHGNHVEQGDITKFDKKRFNQIGSPIMIGGSPCQGFSSANRHSNFLDNPNNLLVKEFIESIKANSNCQVFVLENVPKLLSAGDGKFKQEIYDELSDFEITSGVLTATDFGEAQERKRAFIIGSKIGKIDLPKPTHSPDHYVTVRKALEGLHEDVPNQMDFTKPKPSTIERMQTVPEGGNWRDFPDEFKTTSMFTGKTHSSVYRRLAWDQPSITIANPRKSNLTHPTKNRILSVRECARLFGLKDDFIFKGSLSSMQQQVCNAVPVKLARAVARVVKHAIMRYNIRMHSDKFELV
ncbi:DNA cytosine methyltransferase [Cytobacillus solani]|uniref:DNA cytosine methyltransferase n=1 Tax=Cytobacillus solani TaxID=1637975 RepID=UPI0011542F97|nr:DNA cytosine methyltransferase [Cytobacillus solani]